MACTQAYADACAGVQRGGACRGGRPPPPRCCGTVTCSAVAYSLSANRTPGHRHSRFQHSPLSLYAPRLLSKHPALCPPLLLPCVPHSAHQHPLPREMNFGGYNDGASQFAGGGFMPRCVLSARVVLWSAAERPRDPHSSFRVLNRVAAAPARRHLGVRPRSRRARAAQRLETRLVASAAAQ